MKQQDCYIRWAGKTWSWTMSINHFLIQLSRRLLSSKSEADYQCSAHTLHSSSSVHPLSSMPLHIWVEGKRRRSPCDLCLLSCSVLTKDPGTKVFHQNTVAQAVLAISGKKQFHLSFWLLPEEQKEADLLPNTWHWLVELFLVDINECVTDTHTCQRREHCLNTVGSFKCLQELSCQPGYELKDGECVGKTNVLQLMQ